MAEAAAEFERVAAEASSCTRCRLHQGRTQVVFGQGSPTADLMFVGEGPGFHEDRQGQPFVGPSGKLLNRLLGEIGLRREDVYVTNVVRCRPPGNRDPQPDEIEACRVWMDAQLRLVDPKVVVTLGNFAAKTLLGTTTGITRLRGRTYDFEGRVLLPTFHPSAALRADTSGRTENRTLNGMREDFQALARLLAEHHPAPGAPTATRPVAAGAPTAAGPTATRPVAAGAPTAAGPTATRPVAAGAPTAARPTATRPVAADAPTPAAGDGPVGGLEVEAQRVAAPGGQGADDGAAIEGEQLELF
jgi:DNA polymerase